MPDSRFCWHSSALGPAPLTAGVGWQAKLMKKCSYCGKEYSDEAAFCSIDGQPLGSGMLQPRTPLLGSPRLWSGIGVGICCGIVGGVLEWQQQKILRELGTGI